MRDIILTVTLVPHSFTSRVPSSRSRILDSYMSWAAGDLDRCKKIDHSSSVWSLSASSIRDFSAGESRYNPLYDGLITINRHGKLGRENLWMELFLLMTLLLSLTSFLDAEVDQLWLTKKGNVQIITKKSIKKQGVSSAVAKLRLTLLADDKNHNIIRQVVVEVNKGLRSVFLWKHLGTCEVTN